MSEKEKTKELKETLSTTPVFGSSTTFGTGTGFGGFSGTKDTPPVGKTDTAGEDQGGDEEECTADFTPVVQLQEVETVSGEESEVVLVDFKSKLYRFDHANGEWKERGVGQVRLLESKDNKKIRLLHRQEKTLKIRANHIVMPGTKLQEHSGNEKAWVWSSVDFADEVQKPELFCIRFASAERAREFKKVFDESVARNAQLLAEDEAAEDDGSHKEADQKHQDPLSVKAPATPSGADDVAAHTERLTVKDN